ncbi:MAG: hypothetical protein AAFY71_21450 [Bacteroidota bacterium]
MQHPIANVVIDFEFEKGFVFFLIRNHSEMEASTIRIICEQDIQLMDRKRKLMDLHIVQQLSYLAPRKEIRIPISPEDMFFQDHNEPLFRFRLKYNDLLNKKTWSKQITHDLRAFQDLPSLDR